MKVKGDIYKNERGADRARLRGGGLGAVWTGCNAVEQDEKLVGAVGNARAALPAANERLATSMSRAGSAQECPTGEKTIIRTWAADNNEKGRRGRRGGI